MKAWELRQNVNYVCNKVKYSVDKDGFLHEKRILKRNGCEAWFLCNLTFNQIKDMDFEEIK